jgi:hypothetical protein
MRLIPRFPDPPSPAENEEGLRRFALELVTPTRDSWEREKDGKLLKRRRRPYARRAAVEMFVGRRVLEELEGDGLIVFHAVSTDGSWKITPWGYERGDLVFLTPLGQDRLKLHMGLHVERIVVGQKHRRRKAKGNTPAGHEIIPKMRLEEIEHWDDRPYRPRCYRRAIHATNPVMVPDWELLIVDPAPGPGED